VGFTVRAARCGGGPHKAGGQGDSEGLAGAIGLLVLLGAALQAAANLWLLLGSVRQAAAATGRGIDGWGSPMGLRGGLLPASPRSIGGFAREAAAAGAPGAVRWLAGGGRWAAVGCLAMVACMVALSSALPGGWVFWTPAGLARRAEQWALLGLDRIIALYYRSSALYQTHEHIRCLFF
jgi:hypothetical protein